MPRNVHTPVDPPSSLAWRIFALLFIVILGVAGYLIFTGIGAVDSVLVTQTVDSHRDQPIAKPIQELLTPLPGYDRPLTDSIKIVKSDATLFDSVLRQDLDGFRSRYTGIFRPSAVGGMRRTFMLMVQANGIVVDEKPVLLTGDFRLPGTGPITSNLVDAPGTGVVSVEHLCRSVASVEAMHHLLVLDWGQVVLDPRLGVFGNSFPDALERVNRHGVWVMCSNDSHQRNVLNPWSQRTLFGESLAMGLAGLLEDGVVGDRLMLPDLYFPVLRRCHWLSKGSVTPVLIGPQEGRIIDRDSLKDQDLFVSVRVIANGSSSNEVQSRTVEESTLDAAPFNGSGGSELSPAWQELLRLWGEVDVIGEFDSEAWTPVDYAPHPTRRQAQTLRYAQAEMIGGRPWREAFSEFAFQDSLRREREAAADLSEGLSETLLQRRRLEYRAIYIGFEIAILEAQLSTLAEPLLEQRIRNLKDAAEALTDAVSQGPKRGAVDERALTSTLVHCRQAVRDLFEYALREGEYAALAFLVDSPILPLDCRRTYYGILSSDPEPPAKTPTESPAARGRLDVSTRLPDWTTLEKLCAKLSLPDVAQGGAVGVLAGYPSLARSLESAVDGGGSSDQSRALRILDGREDVGGNRGPAFTIGEPFRPSDKPRLILTPGDSTLEFTGVGQGQMREIHVGFTGFTGKVRVQASSVGIDEGVIELAHDGALEYDPLDPSRVPSIGLWPKRYSDRPYSLRLTAVSDRGERAFSTVTLVPPVAGDVEFYLSGKKLPRRTLANGDRCLLLRPYPNRRTEFDLTIRHTFPDSKDLSVELFHVERPRDANWPSHVLLDLSTAELSQLRGSRFSSLGVWKADGIRPLTATSLKRMEPEAADAPLSVNAGSKDAPVLVDQALVVRVVDRQMSEWLPPMWIAFEPQRPSEYIEIDQVSRMGGLLTVAGHLAGDATLPGLLEKPIPIRLHGLGEVRISDSKAIDGENRAFRTTIELPPGEPYALDVDGYPRAFRWPQGSEFSVEELTYGESRQPIRRGDGLVLFQRSTEKLPLASTLRLDFDFKRRGIGDDWRYIVAGFAGGEKLRFFGDRDTKMMITATHDLTLAIETEVRDHQAEWRLDGNRKEVFEVGMSGSELVTDPFRAIIVFDDHLPRAVVLRPRIHPPVSDPRKIRFDLEGQEEHPKQVEVQLRETTPGDTAPWQTIWRMEYKEGAFLGETIPLDKLARVDEMLLPNETYDLQVLFEDQVGHRLEPPALFREAITILPERLPPPEPTPKEKGSGDEASSPEGRVTIVADGAEELKVEKDGTPITVDGGDGRFSFSVTEYGVGTYKVVAKGVQRAILSGSRTIEIREQGDVRSYEIVMKRVALR